MSPFTKAQPVAPHDADGEVMSQRHIFLAGAEFHFHPDHLDYRGVRWAFKVRYENVAGPNQYRRGPAESSYLPVVTTMSFLLLGAIKFWLHPAAYGAAAILPTAAMLVAAFGTAALAYVVNSYSSRGEYTTIPSVAGNILVARGKDHDKIIGAVQARRLERLRAFTAPDPANSPQEEAAKIQWLLDEGAITQAEHDRLAAALPTTQGIGTPLVE